ncbi:MAG: peptidoglycan domain protein [Muribaculaceae bacterium]|nr:peptidoglycan domain protein [Muribaculaceae bacterium]
MAQIEKFIPFLIFWETSAEGPSLSNEQLFAKAQSRGIADDPDDRGGATMVGITISTYRDYCARNRKATPTVVSLSKLSYPEWLDILKKMFWDRWQADQIVDQRVAEMLVDWVWTGGTYGITIPQRLLSVKADGIVGPQTLAAVNKSDPQILFQKIKQARLSYIDRICRTRPANTKFRSGWLRRINAL